MCAPSFFMFFCIFAFLHFRIFAFLHFAFCIGHICFYTFGLFFSFIPVSNNALCKRRHGIISASMPRLYFAPLTILLTALHGCKSLYHGCKSSLPSLSMLLFLPCICFYNFGISPLRHRLGFACQAYVIHICQHKNIPYGVKSVRDI